MASVTIDIRKLARESVVRDIAESCPDLSSSAVEELADIVVAGLHDPLSKVEMQALVAEYAKAVRSAPTVQ